MNMIKNFLRGEEGAVAMEYALLAGLIAVLIIAGAMAIGNSLCAIFNGIAAGLAGGAAFIPVPCQ